MIRVALLLRSDAVVSMTLPLRIRRGRELAGRDEGQQKDVDEIAAHIAAPRGAEASCRASRSVSTI
jgi:hypothetical protein